MSRRLRGCSETRRRGYEYQKLFRVRSDSYAEMQTSMTFARLDGYEGWHACIQCLTGPQCTNSFAFKHSIIQRDTDILHPSPSTLCIINHTQKNARVSSARSKQPCFLNLKLS